MVKHWRLNFTIADIPVLHAVQRLILALCLALQDCVKTLPLLQKSNDVSLAKSLGYLAWHPKDGKVM